MRSLLTKLNVVKPLSDHLCSPKYSKTHKRCVCGGVVMIGFTLMHLPQSFGIVQICGEFVGVIVHAIGCIPILETIEHSTKP